jgi:hypothetical protein
MFNKEQIIELTELQIKQAIINFLKHLKLNIVNSIELIKEENHYKYIHITSRKKQYIILLFTNITSYIQWSRSHMGLEKQSKAIFGYYLTLLYNDN